MAVVAAHENWGEIKLACEWNGSAVGTETSLHQLSPYIGKIKSTMAASLISQFTDKGDLVYDPFCGSGTIALESWRVGRNVAANDSSRYAHLLTRSKLFPYGSVDEACRDIESVAAAAANTSWVDLRTIPKWVRKFFHPDTLREILAWNSVLERRDLFFLRSCLMGILHHQRPGFLSFPSSHTVPYLREKKFQRCKFPKMYEYRSVRDRLERKVRRALRRMPLLDRNIHRECHGKNAAQFVPSGVIEAIITSPPYMRQLSYGRDNRLRLWFLGISNWQRLDQEVSPPEQQFLALMRSCFKRWQNALRPRRYCVLVLGDTWSRSYGMPLPEVVAEIAVHEIGGYELLCKYSEQIPAIRRVRRECRGSQSETVLVLQRR